MNLDGPLIDALLEHGVTDKQLTLLKNLDAVEYLLETLHDTYECIGCGADNLYGRRDAHTRDCKVMLSRVAIGQHTLEAELEAAENEARRENERRSSPLMSLLRGIASTQPPALIVNQRDYEALQRSGADMNAGNPGFGGIAVQSSPLVREGEALMFRAVDWAKEKP